MSSIVTSFHFSSVIIVIRRLTASDLVSGRGDTTGGGADTGSGDISATNTSSCSITDLSFSFSTVSLSSSSVGDSDLELNIETVMNNDYTRQALST